MSESTPVKVKVLDKEIQVACEPGEKEALLRAATYADEQMRSIRSKVNLASVEKIAMMTAINLANELLQVKDGQSSLSEVSAQLDAFSQELDDVLQQ